MIRINLLPARAEKKKETVKLQLILASGVIVIVFVVSFVVYFVVMSEASALSSQITAGKSEIEVLKTKIGELSMIEQQKKVVEEKLNTIKSLALSVSVFGAFGKARGGGKFDRERFWRHSVGSACIYRVLARERHLEALGIAAEKLALAARQLDRIELCAEELRLAQEALSRITGEFSADDLLGEIFSRFCIGK